MSLGLIYWIFWAVSLLGGAFALWGNPGALVVFALFSLMAFLVGWKVFGLPITGSTE